jgi:hypothetical protein
LPDSVLEPIAKQAGRLHHSISWVVVEAWRAGKGDVAKLAPSTVEAGVAEAGAVGPQIVWLPADVAKEIDAEAARTNRTREALVERAWSAAASRLAKMDARSDGD